MLRKKRIKWTQSLISREFGKDSRTVGKMLAAADLDSARVLTTPQVFAAMMGDLTSERIRETREKADKLEMENREKRGELVSVREFAVVVGRGLESIKANILSTSGLEAEDKDRILMACKRAFESAFAVSQPHSADTESAAADESERVG